MPMFNVIIKRTEDIIFSLLILVILSPILFLLCLVSFLTQGWPIFYVSRRMVTAKKEISIPKFRTMAKDAKNEKYGLERKYMKKGYLDIPLNSEVYTPLGRFMEKTQLVEVPQVILVLLGEMSFVGNRPLPKKNVDLLKENFPDQWQKRFNAPTGMTCVTQIVGKLNLDAKQRLELESLYSDVYMNGNVLRADVYIIFSTIILVLLRGPGTYVSYNSAKKFLKSCIKK